jgi:hypothetical protein
MSLAPSVGSASSGTAINCFAPPASAPGLIGDDVRFDRHEVKYAARKAAQVAAQEAAMWEYYEGDDQRDEDSSSYADAVAEGLERWTR